MFTTRVEKALAAQIQDLKDQLAKSESERRELLDRLLERNNFAPISSKSAPVQENKPPAIEVISPWGSPQPELFDAIKESYLAEEIAHIMNHEGITDPDRARLVAEDRFLESYRTRG